MRVLQIVPSISLVYGGPSQMVLGLSKALADQGVELTILTTNSNGDAGQAPLKVPLDRPVEQHGYKVRYLPCSPFQRYKFSLDLMGWLKERAQDFDIAHIHALFSPFSSIAALVSRREKLPYILRPLGTLDPADLRKKKQLKKIYAAVLEKPNIANAAAIHFTSKEEARISERFGATTRDLIIPLGVTPPKDTGEKDPQFQELKQRLDPNKPIILFMSRIEPKKGLDLLLPALEKLIGEGIDFQFVLAGSNPQDPGYEANIRQKIESSVLVSHTLIAGFVTGGVKAGLLNAADVFVLPSYYENFGIAVAEAMVAGTSVVISDRVHIWPDIAEAEAGWVSGCEVEAIAAGITEALSSREERKRRGENGREFARKNYNWEAIATQTIEAYRQLIDRS